MRGRRHRDRRTRSRAPESRCRSAGATKACGGLDPSQITGDGGLGAAGNDCAQVGAAAVTDLATLTTCLAKQHDCLASRIFQLEVPRVLELLHFTPPDAVTVAPADQDALACLDDAGGTGADVALGKALAKCQSSIEKVGAKLASSRLKTVEKCVDAVFVCAQTKTGDDLTACNAKAKAGCATGFTKNTGQSDGLKAGVDKACGDAATFTAFRTPAGGNLNALLPSGLVLPPGARAVSLGCSPLVTAADYENCLVLHVLGLSDDLTRFEAPLSDALLAAIGCSIGDCSTGPPDVPGITRILDSTGDGTHPFSQPESLAADADGNVYVAGFATNNVFQVTPTSVVKQIASSISADVVASEPNGTAYVGGKFKVFKIAGSTMTQLMDATGDGTHAFNTVGGLFVTTDGTVYVTGQSSNNVFKIASTGTVSQILDATGDGAGHALTSPGGIGVDTAGNVYVTSSNDTVFKISSGSGIVARALTSSGDGTHGFCRAGSR